MADEQETEERAEEKPEAEEKPSAKPEGDDVRKILEDIRSENAQLKGAVQTSTQAAGEARQYVGALLAKIQEVASKRSEGGKTTRQDMFDEDPETAVNQMFNERVAPIVGEYLTNTARDNRTRAAERLGDSWGRYEREIDDFMATMPLDVQAKPGAWESAYRYILAGHIDEEMERREKTKAERKSQAEGVGGQRSSRMTQPLDPAERQLMKAFGMSEKEWREFSSDDIERVPPSRDRKSPFAGRDRDDGR
jgi:uncharacterized coiled-coil DUF342 family protein